MSRWIKFIEFIEDKPKKKTKVFGVWSNSSTCMLGKIKWFPAWRHYCFFPTIEYPTQHSDRCLIEIGEFVDGLNKEHKNKQNNGGKMANELVIANKIEKKLRTKRPEKDRVFPLSPTHRKELRQLRDRNISGINLRLGDC